jgi:hypothetical protein
MGSKNYVCSTCGQDFTRKDTAYRHNLTLHQGHGTIVRTLEYLIGRIKGEFAPADPLSYRRQRRHSINNNPNNLHHGTIAHNSPQHLNLYDKSKDEVPIHTNSNMSADAYHASGPVNASFSKMDEFKSLCKKLFPHPQSEMLIRQMSFVYDQYGPKGFSLEEELEVLRQYDCIMSLSKSAGTDSQSTRKEPLSSHPYLYDLPYEIRLELEQIQAIMKSVPNNTDSIVYDKIEELGKRFRATPDRRIIDGALTYHKGIAADNSRSFLPHRIRVDSCTLNSLGQHQSFHDSVQASTVKLPPQPNYSGADPYSALYAPASYESKSHNYMNGAQSHRVNLAEPSGNSNASVPDLHHESTIPSAFTSHELPDPYLFKEGLHAKCDSSSRHVPTKSNQEGDNVVIQSKQDDNQVDTPVESLENIFQNYGLSILVPRSLTGKDRGVIIPGANSSVPHHVNHTSKNARKKPLYPRPLPKPGRLRASLKPQQIEKWKFECLDQGSAAFERYTASNVADNNCLDDDAVNAVPNEEPTLKVTNHPKLERVTPGPTGNKVLGSSAQYASTQNGKPLESSNPIKTVETNSIALQKLVDEAILKPVLSQMNPEWDWKLFPPYLGGMITLSPPFELCSMRT